MPLDYLLGAMKQRDRKSKKAMPCTSEIEKLPQPGCGPHEAKNTMSDPKRAERSLDEEKADRALSVAG